MSYAALPKPRGAMRSPLLMLAGLLSLLACQPITSTTQIAVVDFFFFPGVDTITAGKNDSATIVFQWDSLSSGHNITWDSAPGPLPPDATTMTAGTYTVYLTPGTYGYHCSIHYDSFGMAGVIVILPNAGMSSSIAVASSSSPSRGRAASGRRVIVLKPRPHPNDPLTAPGPAAS